MDQLNEIDFKNIKLVIRSNNNICFNTYIYTFLIMSKKLTPIPIIGTAIVNTPFWIKNLIDSVDYPTDELVIFDNNGRGQLIKELDEIAKQKHKFIKKITVCHLPRNIGCVGAWNMIIKCYLMSPYWIITNHDISFSPGFLEEMIRLASDPEIGMVHGGGGDFGDGSYDLFLIKDWVIQKYGLFDENLYPGYGEDVDYIMRLKHHPIKKISSVEKVYYHGLGTDYYKTGGQTKKGEPELEEKLNKVNLINFEYLSKKWGPRWRQTWPYFNPFNNPDFPISYTSYDLKYIRRKYLGF
jgi:GT2 family glycosyltransferase